MKRYKTLVTLSVLSALCGCVAKEAPRTQVAPVVSGSSEAIPTIKKVPMEADDKTPSATVTLTGTLTLGGVSSGKTLAAWNGIPTGETYYRFSPNADVAVVQGAGETFMLRVPSKEEAEAWVGQQVVVTGVWNIPETVEADPSVPRQMPVTLHPNGASRVVQPEVMFTAASVQGVE